MLKKEKGGQCDDGDLTTTDVEKEKRQTGGDVGGEHDVDQWGQKSSALIALCPSVQEEISKNI